MNYWSASGSCSRCGPGINIWTVIFPQFLFCVLSQGIESLHSYPLELIKLSQEAGGRLISWVSLRQGSVISSTLHVRVIFYGLYSIASIVNQSVWASFHRSHLSQDHSINHLGDVILTYPWKKEEESRVENILHVLSFLGSLGSVQFPSQIRKKKKKGTCKIGIKFSDSKSHPVNLFF